MAPGVKSISQLLGCSLILTGLCTAPAPATVVINEFLASNASTNLDADYYQYSDWIELYNTGDSAVDLEGYFLSDDLESTRWRIPAVTIEPGAYRLFWADGRTGADTLLVWNDGVYSVIVPALSGDDVSIFDDAENEDWSLSSGRNIELDPQENDVVYQGSASLAVHADGVRVSASASPPANSAGFASLRFAFHPGTATGRFLYVFLNGDARLVHLLENSADGIAVDLGVDGWQEVEIPLQAFELGGSIDRIDFGGDLEGTFYLDDIRLTNGGQPSLHTNFQLRGRGEQIGLFNTDGVLQDAVDYDEQLTDVSYGRQPDGGSEWAYFATPTPAAPNGAGLSQADRTDAPAYSLPGGFYTGPQTLTLSGPAAAAIHYTRDGSIPTTASPRYTGAVDVDATGVVRARTFSADRLPSQTVTQTYFIDEETTLPVVSVATDPKHLWDDTIGIYVDGTNGIVSDDSGEPKNSNQDWERPVSVEFFEPDGTLGFSLDAGASIYGAFSRHFPQKSLAIDARSRYGADEIDYRIFPDSPVDSFKSFILRNGGNDWRGSMMDDEFMQTLLRGQMDVDIQAYRPAVLFLNGQYWGIHNIREKLNRDYLAAHHGVDPDIVNILEADSAVKTGKADDYHDLVALIESGDMSSQQTYDAVRARLDVDAYMNHQIAQIYFGAGDNFFKNVKYWHPGTTDGKWRWFLYDTDHGFGRHRDNTLAMATDPTASNRFGDISWGTFMLRKLLENDAFRDNFIQHFARHINTTFAPERAIRLVDRVQEAIAPEMPRHIDRWNGECGSNMFGRACYGIDSITEWNREVEKLRSFAPLRPAQVRNHIASHFGLGGTAALALHSSDAGYIQINEAAVPDGEGTYFTDVPLRVTAVAHAGFRFSHWQGLSSADTPSISVTLAQDSELSATFVAAPAAEELPVVINEIMAVNDATLPDGHGEFEDWIELYNPSDNPVDVGGLFVSDAFDQSPQWQIPADRPDSTTVPPRGYLLLWADGDTDQGALHVDLRLSSGGEQIGLLQISGFDTTFVDSFTFGEQTADISFGRLPDGGDRFANFGTPTPGEANNDTDTAVIELDGPQPARFSLAQNHPNPFNPTTTIAYSLAEAADVRLTVYAANGQRVTTLVSAFQPAGHYQATWDAQGQASGLYFYRVQAGSFVGRKRMLLLK